MASIQVKADLVISACAKKLDKSADTHLQDFKKWMDKHQEYPQEKLQKYSLLPPNAMIIGECPPPYRDIKTEHEVIRIKKIAEYLPITAVSNEQNVGHNWDAKIPEVSITHNDFELLGEFL